jgi:hypothetical protein
MPDGTIKPTAKATPARTGHAPYALKRDSAQTRPQPPAQIEQQR